MLVSPAEEAAERPRRRQLPILVAVATVVALLLGGAAFAGARLWYGSGMQPEEATPSTVVAFVRLDLSPGYGQRFAINNLIKKFSQEDGKDAIDELKKEIFDSLDIDEAAYRKHVEPWFADRIGAGLWLDGKNQPYGLMTLAADDEAKASTGLAELQRKKGAKEFGFVMREGFALVALGDEASQEAAEAAAAEADRETLASAGQFRRGLEWLPARQTALAWIDFAKFGAMMQAMMGDALDGFDEEFEEGLELEEEFNDDEMPPFGQVGLFGGLFPGMAGLPQDDDLKGQLILGASATDDGVEIRFRGFDVPSAAPAGSADARSAADALPADSAVAGSLRLGEIGEALTNGLFGATVGPLPEEAFEGMTPDEAEEMRQGMQEAQQEMQAIAEGFKAVSGAKITLSVTMANGGGAAFIVTGETTSTEKAAALAKSLEKFGDDGDFDVTLSGNKVELKSKGYEAGTGSLGDQELYRQALAGAPEQANVVLYVDVQRLLADEDMSSKERAQVKPVKAIGMAAGLDGKDQVGLMRVVIK